MSENDESPEVRDTNVAEISPEKKTSKKTTAKKTAAKKVVKKAAKKATKKAVKKTAKSVSVEEKEDSLSQNKSPKESGKTQESGQGEKLQSTSETDKRIQGELTFGRVPGGGPVKENQVQEAGEAQKSDKNGQNGQNNNNSPKNRKHHSEQRRPRKNRNNKNRRKGGEDFDGGSPQTSNELEGPKIEVKGLLELTSKGFGFLRVAEQHFAQDKNDVFVSPEQVRNYGLRRGQWILGFSKQGRRGQQLVEVTSVNGIPPEEAKKLPAFEELKAINPERRLAFETGPDRFTTRVLDLMSPVGRGQRGLIVSPPRSGKTTLLLHLAEAATEIYDESLHVMVLLADERPEEVTEFRRRLPGVEIFASSNDESPRNHIRIAELCIERAKRLVEGGKDVFLLMDSITRLARAYNNNMRGGRGRGIASGGLMVGALEAPRRLFAAARNTREAGSLTILATALVQTNSKADEAIFQEFKGTGNMELVLDRRIAEQYLYPAVDIFKSGTRREELLLPEHTLHKIHMIRRGLAGHKPVEAMERLLFFLKKFPNNPQMLLEIKG